MRTRVMKPSLALMCCLLCSMAVGGARRTLADQFPMTPGDFWEVTGVNLKDGGALAYANFLASEWKADQEFAKSKGWIKGYMVLGNAYARKGEPDLYLIVISDHLPSGPEADKHTDEYMAWKKKTAAQLMKESGNRLEVRELGSNMLLQELKFRK